MRYAISPRRLLVAAAVAGAAVTAVPSVASAASSCTYNDISGRVDVIDGSGSQSLRVTRSNQFIAVADGQGPLRFCDGSAAFATVTNTDLINVLGHGNTAGGYVVDNGPGPLAPGRAVESDGKSEIETLIQAGGVSGTLEVIGTQQADSIRAAAGGGIMVGPDADVDVRYREALGTTLTGLGGNDFLSGRGDGAGQKPITTQLIVDGGGGHDTLVDGLNPFDTLRGRTGNDTLFSVDGNVDFVFGDEDFDSATVDSKEAANAVAEVVGVGSVGKLRLAPAVIDAEAGKVARLEMSWTHPKAWSKLRKIELRLYRGTEAVAKVVAAPKSGRLTGALLARGSQLSHRGKTVTATLALRLPKSLAGAQLRAAVAATDRAGHRQLEPSAGVIRVAG